MLNIKSLSIVILLIVVFHNRSAAQLINENWLLVKSDNKSRIYIISSELNELPDEIYVWTIEKFLEPFLLEGVEENIVFAKRNYIFSKSQLRYSIIDVVLYDANENILKSYNYEHNSELSEFKYDTPILKDSDAEVILNECHKLIANKKNK